MKAYDIIIIGAGPGGIFAAYELMKQKPDLKVAVFEAGHMLNKRKCPIDGVKIKSCIHCKSCSIMSGFGGAGAFSDGKYNITNDFGGTLYEHIGKQPAIELMKYVDEINLIHGGEGTRLYSTAGTKFKKICMQNGLNLLNASVRHLGTDINYVVLENLYNELEKRRWISTLTSRLLKMEKLERAATAFTVADEVCRLRPVYCFRRKKRKQMDGEQSVRSWTSRQNPTVWISVSAWSFRL